MFWKAMWLFLDVTFVLPVVIAVMLGTILVLRHVARVLSCVEVFF